MIEMDMALETELGVDSIKRVEIEATGVEALAPQTAGDVDMATQP